MTMQADKENKPRGILRRLAREATIFALLGMVVVTIGLFVKLDMEDRATSRSKAVIAVYAGIDFSFEQPAASTIKVPLTNGTILQVRWCPIAWDEFGNPVKDPRYRNCRLFDFMRKRELVIVPESIQVGSTDQIAIEKDYWTAYKDARHQHITGEMLGSLFFGLWGFPAGLGLWAFYRLVRFAVRG
jgi:hypothetical protein